MPLALATAVILGITACAALTPRKTESLLEAESLVRRLRARQARIRTFAGRGGMTFQQPDRKYYFDVTVVTARPDRLRIQAFDFMGRPVLIMTVNSQELSLLDYRAEVYQHGPPTQENVNRFLPLGLTVPALISLFSGGQPWPAYDRAAIHRERTLGRDTVVLSLLRPDGGWVERIWLSDPELRVDRVEMAPEGGQVEYALELSGYGSPEGAGDEAVPRNIRARDLQADSTLMIEYKEVRVNPDLPETLFTVKPPPGVTVEPMPEHR